MARSDERKDKRRRHSKKSSSRRRRRSSRYSSDSSSGSSGSSGSSSSSSSSSEDERVLKKQRKRSEKVLASFGYTNDTNPFGDSNLAQPFVWRKKYEEAAAASDSGSDDGRTSKHSKNSKKKKKKSKRPSEKELKRNQLERVEEIRKARQRREEREAEKEEMERLRSEELRLKDAEQYEDWQQKEEEFHLSQAAVRSKLRIKQRREKPVDLLAKNLLLADRGAEEEDGDAALSKTDVRVEKRRPHAIVEVLSMDELEELKENIRAYVDLEVSRGGKNKEFWELMMVVTKDRISRLRRSQREESASRERGAIHDSVNDTIHDMLHGKNQRELNELKKEVEVTIDSAASKPGVDVEFWEEVAQQIDVYKARARLTELHNEMLNTLRDLIDKHDDKQTVDNGRPQSTSVPGGLDDSAEARAMESSEANKGLEDQEEKLGAADEVSLGQAMPTWSDKYQPRKPRYFNRVKTGYDWNKYNQTHYDHDNPPPKVVQGYKFNLFYPDLIDKASAPRYVLEKANSPEFCIIRFTAGPPYQDIAFKIVNREWEHSHKRGFKSVFERGILHLYFNFKRHRYRR